MSARVKIAMSEADRQRAVDRVGLEAAVREVLGAGAGIAISDLAPALKARVEQAELLARAPVVDARVPVAARERLAPERRSITRKLTLPRSPSAKPGDDPSKVYLTVGFNADDQVREVFIRADKVGSFISGILDGLAITISLALQYGTPLKVICAALEHQRFEPEGLTGDPEFPTVSSVLDYVARYLRRFVPRKEEADD